MNTSIIAHAADFTDIPLQTASGRDSAYVKEIDGIWKFGGKNLTNTAALSANHSSWAESLNISGGYLQNIYPKYFGVSCFQDVIESRILHACELLNATQMTLSEIAEECGYRNVEHFIRQFKERMHVTPKKYRCK